jgi:hypothetical protein
LAIFDLSVHQNLALLQNQLALALAEFVSFSARLTSGWDSDVIEVCGFIARSAANWAGHALLLSVLLNFKVSCRAILACLDYALSAD